MKKKKKKKRKENILFVDCVKYYIFLVNRNRSLFSYWHIAICDNFVWVLCACFRCFLFFYFDVYLIFLQAIIEYERFFFLVSLFFMRLSTFKSKYLEISLFFIQNISSNPLFLIGPLLKVMLKELQFKF